MAVEIPIEYYEENRRFVPPNEPPHVEGILLFSEENDCYGEPIDHIVAEKTDDISSCPQALQVDPHADALDRVLEEALQSRIFFCSNSLWLIHHRCLEDAEQEDTILDSYRDTTPLTGVLIWVDSETRDREEVKQQLQERYREISPTITTDLRQLKVGIHMYLATQANPAVNREGVIKWNNEAYERMTAQI